MGNCGGMTDEAEPGSKKRGKLWGWILVVIGVLIIAQGFVIPYSPSLTPEAWTSMTIWFVASTIVGSLLVIVGGWTLLKTKK